MVTVVAPRVLFLADQFASARRSATEGHPGGAELTDVVAIGSCPWPIEARRCAELSPSELSRYDLIVVANASTATPTLLRALTASARHVLFEHDLRICRWRGNFPRAPEPWHRFAQRCVCLHPEWRDVLQSARGMVYLTASQRSVYWANPWFRPPNQEVVLGCSLFAESLLERAERRARVAPREGAAVFASRNPIKGYAQALRYCRDHGLRPAVFRDISPEAVLARLERAQVFIYLPVALEPAGRMPVEARLLGCRVVTNGHLGVAGEPFWRAAAADAFHFLGSAPARFWRLVEQLMQGTTRAPAEIRVDNLRQRRAVRHVSPW